MTFTNAVSPQRVPFTKNPLLLACVAVFTALWLYTFLHTSDMANWWLENALVWIALIGMVTTYSRAKFSDLSYLLICIYLCLHVYGAMHTYAENPFGYWLMEQCDFSRNHYDRIVHFSFGFLLAYPMRECFLVMLRFPSWVAWLLPIEITLSISAAYELLEWAVADIFFPEQGIAYLGSQGDIWGAQKDIALAVTGAILATSLVSYIKKRWRIGMS